MNVEICQESDWTDEPLITPNEAMAYAKKCVVAALAGAGDAVSYTDLLNQHMSEAVLGAPADVASH